jgi:hypothetical protein
MEIEYRITKEDYLEFNKLYYSDQLRKRIGIVILIVGISALFFGSIPFNWNKFLIGTSASAIVTFGLFYFIPLFRANKAVTRSIEKDKSDLVEKKLTIVDEGLQIESENKVTNWKWESIVSVHSNEQFIYIFLVDKRYMLFPKRIFRSESDAVNFMGLIQSKFPILKPGVTIQSHYTPKKPSYLTGLVCLVPVVGAVIGIIYIINGISKYKDKWFVIMGSGGVLINICYWYFAFYANAFGFQGIMVQTSQRQLNSVMKAVEFYKIKNGYYPDSLGQINDDNSDIWIYDPLTPGEHVNKSNEYNYQKIGNHYYLFSSGPDGIPNTWDDIYPQVAPADSAKFGLIRKSR